MVATSIAHPTVEKAYRDRSRLLRDAYSAEHNTFVIRSFKDDRAGELFLNGKHKDFANIQKAAMRKLLVLDAAIALEDLRTPPGNKLEALKADRAGQHSIRINDQYRICFIWTNDGVDNVEIVDYH